MFPHMGTQEIIIILALALILFGPKKLPEIGRSLGQGLRELKKTSREVMDSIDSISNPETEPEPVWRSEAEKKPEPEPNYESDENSDRVVHHSDESTIQPTEYVNEASPEQASAQAPIDVVDQAPVEPPVVTPDQAKENADYAADSNRN